MSHGIPRVEEEEGDNKRPRFNSPEKDEEKEGLERHDDSEEEWEPLIDENEYKRSRLDAVSKAAAMRVSHSVVSLVTHNLPYHFTAPQVVFMATGLVLESEHIGDDRFLSSIIAPATLFKRTNDLPSQQIEVDVYLSDSKLYKGQLLACDFHNNLAIITVDSDLPLQTPTLRGLDDVSLLNLSEPEQPFQLHPHSDLYKIFPGTKILTLTRFYEPPYDLHVYPGVFSSYNLAGDDCKEVYWVKDSSYKGDSGGVVINCCGEVIGFMFSNSPFLPSNLLSRWWNYYRSYKKFCRPRIGMEITNLDTAVLGFLEELRNKFHNIGTGVVVTKVDKDTPAYCSGIRRKDVIVKYNGILVRSKMEFFEKIWDTAEKSVELTVLRVSDGKQLNLSMMIEDTTPDKFYRWELPVYKFIDLT